MTTSSQRLYLPFEQVFTNLGAIGAGWKVYTYLTNSSTPKATYSNTGLTIENTNPIVADSSGRFGNIYGTSAAIYKFILKDANDNTIQTVDPINPQTFNLSDFSPQPAAYWGLTSGTASAYILTSNVDISATGYNSSQIFLVSFHTACNAAPTLAIDSNAALNLKKFDGSGGTAALIAGDVQAQRYWATNNGSDIIILNPQYPYIGAINIGRATTTAVGVSYLNSDISIANNVSTPNTQIDCSAGVFQFSDNSGQAIATAKTKILQSSGAWTAGNLQNGLFTGARAINTWYHCFAIYNPTTGATDFGFDTSVTAANIPSGYTKYYLIESILTDGSGNIIGFIHSTYNGQSQIVWNAIFFDMNLIALPTSATLETLTSPLGRIVNATINARIKDPASGSFTAYGLFTNPQQPDTTPSATAYNIMCQRDNAGFYFNSPELCTNIRTNLSSQIRIRFDNVNGILNAFTTGWYK